MSKTFLTREEVEELTKRKKACAQKRVLKKQRIHFVEDADGNPKIMRSVLEKRLEGAKVELGGEVTVRLRKNLEEMHASGQI